MTPLAYALLGLIRDEPRSGYGLRKVFETTPMGNYSSSPGSIYPALKNLEKAGLVESRATGKKSVLAITTTGETAFATWLAQPVTSEEDPNIALLRFAFLQNNRPQSLDFLMSYARCAHAKVIALRNFLDSEPGQALPLQARLAVYHGLKTTEAAAEWAADAYRQLNEDITP
ncbi:transcriptional regulator PadR-like family protein [Asticcacaulis biprosthecium C19]|uniref:Transcriptional regulator PadR-like family protein n=1 Tax=Asticcacaulis biprosthecium C19 TaxID=715226 RepID=F4QKW3_9CAUL|nr:PadR family transcriptional regulator [Asticcacaulis biprosthecium]EGF92186.1 transcriptional regulator PadR-like family protein [Asticcacaulis biprosthecium C19]